MPVDTVDTKLIFGLRTSEYVTLTVTAEPGPQAPDLLIRTNGQTKDVAIACHEGAWSAPLPVGDHVIRMVATDDTWFEGGLKFTLSSASTLVIYTGGASPQPTVWRATTGAADPKNPWPPPLAPEPEPLASAAWLSATLQTLSEQVSVARTLSWPARRAGQHG